MCFIYYNIGYMRNKEIPRVSVDTREYISSRTKIAKSGMAPGQEPMDLGLVYSDLGIRNSKLGHKIKGNYSTHKEQPLTPLIKKERIGKPDVAYMSKKNLDIIRGRIKFEGSDEQLTARLVVFVGCFKQAEKATEIVMNQREEIAKGYLVKLNNSTIAQEATNIDDWQTPFGYKMYECLGVFDNFKGTGKVSTDKSTRGWSTSQKYRRENGELTQYIDYPDNLYINDTFFARPDDAVEVRHSKYEKTDFWWQA